MLFTLWGSTNVVNIPIDVAHAQNAYNATVVQQLRQCGGWFFSGGDQSRVISTFFAETSGGGPRTRTPALQAIYDTFNANGGVIAGSSAGTACQPSGVMITDGQSYYGLLDGTKPQTFPNPTDNYVTFGALKSRSDICEDFSNELSMSSLLLVYSIFASLSHLLWLALTFPSLIARADGQGGLGFFQYGLLDTHFGERGRQGRFIRLLLDTRATVPQGRSLGFGMFAGGK
jgi:cyanophycinase